MAQRLHRETGSSSTGPTGVTGASVAHRRLFDWIADEWRHLQGLSITADWRWMRKSLPSTASTSLTSLTYTGASLGAADFGRWRRYAQGDGQDIEYTPRVYLPADPTNVFRLAWMEREQFRRVYEDTTQPAGQPLDWTIDDEERLLIGPVSDQAYRIRADYSRAATELEDDDDVPTGLPTEFHMLLVWKALISAGTYSAASETVTRARRNARRMQSQLILTQGRMIALGDALA